MYFTTLTGRFIRFKKQDLKYIVMFICYYIILVEIRVGYGKWEGELIKPGISTSYIYLKNK